METDHLVLPTELLRISVFSPLFLDYRHAPVGDWWRSATGSEPEQINQNANAKQLSADGSHLDGRLVILSSPGRIDWNLLPSPIPYPNSWPNVGTWPTSIGPLYDLAKKWLIAFEQPITRLALSANVLKVMSDRNSAYEGVAAALGDFGLRFPAGTSDFLLQFNIAVPSKEGPPGMKVNRLARWGAGLYKPLVQVILSPGTPVIASGDNEIHSLRAELDFNTSGEWTEAIPSEKVMPLLGELVDTAVAYIEERFK